MNNILSSLFASIGNAVAPNLQEQAAAAEEQVQLAFAALMGVQVIMVIELFVIAMVVWKNRKA